MWTVNKTVKIWIISFTLFSRYLPVLWVRLSAVWSGLYSLFCLIGLSSLHYFADAYCCVWKRNGDKCAGFGCRSGYKDCPGVGKDGAKLTFHGFPIRNPELWAKWVEANPRKDFILTEYSKLCWRHLHRRDFTQEWRDRNVARQKKNAAVSEKQTGRFLKNDAVPSALSNALA